LIDGLYSPSGVRIAKAAGSQAPERFRLFFHMSDQKQQHEFGSHPKPFWSSLWQAKLAKLRREILAPPSAKGGGAGEGFDVTKSGDSRVGLVGFPSVGKSTLLNKLTGTFSEVGSSLPRLFVMFAYNVTHVMACAGYEHSHDHTCCHVTFKVLLQRFLCNPHRYVMACQLQCCKFLQLSLPTC
jgi:hypothetical protein